VTRPAMPEPTTATRSWRAGPMAEARHGEVKARLAPSAQLSRTAEMVDVGGLAELVPNNYFQWGKELYNEGKCKKEKGEENIG
jgi:hypothetical protein